ncbi:hypothetical protein B7494_g6799 [Chlorociboria aeruginascens]|nr:hypothetical protein B7494_g6799 [Chlorociboria aeruginascens]
MLETNRGSLQIPVINISRSVSELDVARELVEAAATYGFIYLKNEGEDIPGEAVEQAFDLSRIFFSSPMEEKAKIKISETVSHFTPFIMFNRLRTLKNAGWVGMHTETLDAKNQRIGDFKEAFNIHEFKDGKAQQTLPPSLVNHESDLNTFQQHCHNLCLKLLKLFAIGLEVDSSSGGSTYFSSRHQGGPSGCTLRLLYYPTVPAESDYNPILDIRAGAHSDYGSITLLFQRPGQPGLEIIPPSTQTGSNAENFSSTAAWTPVPVFPPGTENDPSPPILVNIGDAFEYWTNGLLKSTVHRVVFPKEAKIGGEDRYSIAYFCHPVGDTVLEAIPSEKVRLFRDTRMQHAMKPMTSNEHLMSRLKATYLGLYKDGQEAIAGP